VERKDNHRCDGDAGAGDGAFMVRVRRTRRLPRLRLPLVVKIQERQIQCKPVLEMREF